MASTPVCGSCRKALPAGNCNHGLARHIQASQSRPFAPLIPGRDFLPSGKVKLFPSKRRHFPPLLEILPPPEYPLGHIHLSPLRESDAISPELPSLSPARLRPVCSSGNSQALPSLRDGPLPLEPRAASHFRRTHRAYAAFSPQYLLPALFPLHSSTHFPLSRCIYIPPTLQPFCLNQSCPRNRLLPSVLP